ncbi:MAG: DNA repair protein RecO [Lachnospiraceae bacterium]|nr:DNA repair protein RecO [Lachnospiraceae bacterium]
MAENVQLRGMILAAFPSGEYDRRVLLLTEDRGKVTGFVRGARRPGNQLMAASEPFVFGTFTAFQGRDAYTIVSASVENYFEEIRDDFTDACYGGYFLEFASYYSRENDDDREVLKLLYKTLSVLLKKLIPHKLIRCIYELRLMSINGEGPQVFECARCGREEALDHFSVRMRGTLCSSCLNEAKGRVDDISPLVRYTMQYIISSDLEKLYSFSVPDEAVSELSGIMDRYRAAVTDKEFKSLEILESIGLK